MPRITLQGELSCPYQRTDNAYPRYLDTVINDVKNEVDCEVKCTFYENFVCRSFAYYSSARQCFVSGDDTGKGLRRDDPDFASQFGLNSRQTELHILCYRRRRGKVVLVKIIKR